MNIVVYDSNGDQKTYNIEAFQKEVVSFGRQPDNDIVLKHDFVSRVHGVIYQEGQSYYVEDLDSTNGIYVNGSLVKRTRIQNGDSIVLARSRDDMDCVRFFIEESTVGPPLAYSQPQAVKRSMNNDSQGINVNIYNQVPSFNANVRMKTNRSMILYFVFTILTFGIYSMYFFSVLGSDVNYICTKRDGKRQMHFIIAFWLLGTITFGIVPLVWYTTLAERIGEEARTRGIDTNFGGGSFWLWDILGSLIIVGPFIYMNQLCKTMNMISTDYNQKGY